MSIEEGNAYANTSLERFWGQTDQNPNSSSLAFVPKCQLRRKNTDLPRETVGNFGMIEISTK
jgi:hypothetical protein